MRKTSPRATLSSRNNQHVSLRILLRPLLASCRRAAQTKIMNSQRSSQTQSMLHKSEKIVFNASITQRAKAVPMITQAILGLLPRLEYTERSQVPQCALNSSYECRWQVQHPIPEEKKRKRVDDRAI